MSDEESQDNLITLEKLDSDSADLWEQREFMLWF